MFLAQSEQAMTVSGGANLRIQQLRPSLHARSQSLFPSPSQRPLTGSVTQSPPLTQVRTAAYRFISPHPASRPSSSPPHPSPPHSRQTGRLDLLYTFFDGRSCSLVYVLPSLYNICVFSVCVLCIPWPLSFSLVRWTPPRCTPNSSASVSDARKSFDIRELTVAVGGGSFGKVYKG
jgi:hypothetical protein